MAPISPGMPAGPPRKAKKPTATTKTHRFEPFSRRIARLKIDPVRRIDRYRPVEQDLSLSESRFRTTFDHWADLNQSETYCTFSRQVRLKCESLPQLLHHADTIHELLVKAIGKKDENALEPLLTLVEAFAHDLGEKFEKYFAEIVRLVLQVAVSHDAAEVIEWCFKCLAWIFRFLSRLLVPDLSPLLAIMLPYLGLEKQKHYITRFAAESLAFLLRKAAMKHSAKPQYVAIAVEYLLKESQQRWNSQGDVSLYQVGVMTLFSEAAMGVDGNVHSSAPALISSVIQNLLRNETQFNHGHGILEGTLVSLIHQTGAAGFEPIFNVIEDTAISMTADASELEVRLSAGLFHLVVGARKGTRVAHWSKTAKAVLWLGSIGLKTFSLWPDQLTHHLTTIAMVIQYAPMDQLLPHVQQLLQSARDLSNPFQFFSFCDVLANLGQERFEGLLLPQFQAYVLSQWQQDEAGLLLLLRNLHNNGTMTRANGRTSLITCPGAWESRIVQLCQKCARTPSDEFDVYIAAFMQLSDVIKFPRDEDTRIDLQTTIHQLVLYGMHNPEVVANLKSRFALGRGFQTYLRLSPTSTDLDSSFWDLICKLPAEVFGLQPFLHGLGWYAAQTVSAESLAAQGKDYLRLCFLRNLSTDVISLKILSVQLIKDIFADSDPWLEATVKLMTTVLETPYTLRTERDIKAQLREVSRLQKRCTSLVAWGRLLPTFCMGLMPHYHATPLQELCSAIAEMCSEHDVEDFIVETCTKWLQTVAVSLPHVEDQKSHDFKLQDSPFQCSNVLFVDHVSEKTFDAYSNSHEVLAKSFARDHEVHLVQVPASSRHLALQLLLQIPHLAEKRSRFLVPIFLTAHVSQRQLVVHQDASLSVSSHTLSPEVSEQTWSYQDRKVLLELFGKFVNPGVLYRSVDVREALLELLTNGSSEIQHVALKALFTWKSPSIQPYEDALLRLLDGKADSGELDLLLHPNQGQSSIDAKHRAGLMPVLLRLVFGMMINQSKSKGPQEGKRKATLRKLFNLSDEEIVSFLEISFGPLAKLSSFKGLEEQNFPIDQDVIPTDQQYGFLRTMQTMMSILGSQISPFGDKILPPLLYCLARACHHINGSACHGDDQPRKTASALVRNIRRSGLECLVMMFEICEDLEWTPYIPTIFAQVVCPRLPTLAIETAQGVSGLLRLFSTWSKSEKTVTLLEQNPQLMLSVVDCIGVPSAKDEVKLFALNDVVLNVAKITQHGEQNDTSAVNIIQSNIESLLANLNAVLQDGPSQNVLEAVVNILPMLAPFAASSSRAQALLSSLTVVLGKGHKLNPRLKGNLLKAVQSLLEDHYEQIGHDSLDQIYNLTSSLFDYFKDEPNRATLCAIIGIFGRYNLKLMIILKICRDLNNCEAQEPTGRVKTGGQETQSAKDPMHSRLDKIDYDHQISGFTAINELDTSDTTAQQWKPILNNLLYFARTHQDFSIRSNAVACLRHFIVRASLDGNGSFDALMQATLLPAFEKGLKEPSETIRADFVGLLGVFVQHVHNAPDLEDMKVLLVGGDAEASFFHNVLHIQHHRRLRAVRRLIKDTEDGALGAKTLSRYFLPLLERFVFDVNEDENTLALKGQAIVAISSLLKCVEWASFRATFRRYRGLMDSKVLKDRDVMKLLNGAIDALISARRARQLASTEPQLAVCQLSSTMPPDTSVATELTKHFVPKLTAYIKHNDEAQASLRLPASVVAVKATLMLRPEEAAFIIPGVLLDVCNVLRSRDQQIRDEARNTLAEVSVLLGPQYLHLVVKELRTTLNRGYQVHVLTYTMHKIIVSMMPQLQTGDLDYCLSELISLVMDDIFGSTGLEKDNDDYVSSMKEVKGNKKNSKSFGIIETLAGVASVKMISTVLEPLRVLLNGNLGSKQQQHVDEVLRTIGLGLIQNPAAGTRDMLMLSYELISDLYKVRDVAATKPATNDEINKKRFLIQSASNHEMTTGVKSLGLHKIHRFALDLLRSNLQRHQNLLSAENLHGFLPVIGDAVISQQEDVKTSALRLISTIVKLPIPELGENAALYVKEAVQVVENASNTNSDAPQAALKLVASMLRERQGVVVRKRDLEYLLHKVIPELEEPDRQGSSFNLVKAVMAREVKMQIFELPELYEMADKVSVMMVANHSQSARDVARGVYVYFLLEYPQTKKRWEKQLKFLAENLEYQYPEGRQSVMEAINALITKLGSERAQEPISWFFLPVVLRLANDESKACREMAGALLAQLFTKANAEEMEKMLQAMRAWVEQTEEQTLTVAGMQAYGYFLQAMGPGNEAPHVRSSIETVLLTQEDDILVDGELQLEALGLLSKLATATPAATMTKKQASLWSAVRSMLSNSNVRIQSIAATLIGAWFQDIVLANSKPELKLQKMPLSGSYGILLEKSTMTELLKASLQSLRRLDATSPTLGPSTVRNLIFLARCFDANKADIDISKRASADPSSDTDSADEELEFSANSKIPAIQYLLHQLSAILRRESLSLTSVALQPKASTLELLSALIFHISSSVLRQSKTLTTLLTPLRHITADDLVIPNSSDPTFEGTYTGLVSAAHDVMESLHTKVGDGEYVKAMTQVSREVRDRREERRKKRRINAVVDPERSAVRKKVKNERKSARKKEIAHVHRNRRSLV